MRTKNIAFILGYEAADCGYPRSENPYYPNSDAWYNWEAGYTECVKTSFVVA